MIKYAVYAKLVRKMFCLTLSKYSIRKQSTNRDQVKTKELILQLLIRLTKMPPADFFFSLFIISWSEEQQENYKISSIFHFD